MTPKTSTKKKTTTARRHSPRSVQRMVGPSERTLGRELKRLRAQIDNSKDPIVTRISYAMECAIRWAREHTVDWPMPAESAIELADLLRKEWPNDIAHKMRAMEIALRTAQECIESNRMHIESMGRHATAGTSAALDEIANALRTPNIPDSTK